MQEKQREEKIKRWFDMWLTGERQELSRLFDKMYITAKAGDRNITELRSWSIGSTTGPNRARWSNGKYKPFTIKTKIPWWNGISAVPLQARCSSLMG